jgi:Zn-dependent peptidase ImmA (M78 family)
LTTSSDHIRREAARLLDAAGVTHEPVPLRDIVSALNLELLQRRGEPFTSEAALESRGDGRTIVLNGPGDERRRRFTIAHEIGHFVLHPERVSPERGGPANEAGRRVEREANQFAAELLMPEERVRRAFREHGGDVGRLCDRFDVSRGAMRARLRRLGLIEPDSRYPSGAGR